jgi:hypothetical protein
MFIQLKQYSIQFYRLPAIRLPGRKNQGMPDIVGGRGVVLIHE